MPTVTLTGILTDAFNTEQISDRFRKRIFWLNEINARDPRYANTWEIELHQDDCDRLDEFKPGDTLVAECDVRGRKVQTNAGWRVFTALKCNSLNKAGSVAAIHANPPNYQERRGYPHTPKASLYPYNKP